MVDTLKNKWNQSKYFNRSHNNGKYSEMKIFYVNSWLFTIKKIFKQIIFFFGLVSLLNDMSTFVII